MDVYYRNIELFNKMLINIFGKDDMDPLHILKDILDKDNKNKRCINLNSIPDDYRYILKFNFDVKIKQYLTFFLTSP